MLCHNLAARIARYSAATLAVLLAACGDNGGGTDASRVVYAVNVAVSPAPVANGLQLQLNSADTVTIGADIAAAPFASGLTDGQAWTVAVTQQPKGETCTITGPNPNSTGSQATGTVSSQAVTISVKCTQTVYTLTGTLTGAPAGQGLTLQDQDSGVTVSVPAGATTFSINPPALYDGTQFNVQVLSQPTSPVQNCVPAKYQGSVDPTQQPTPQSQIVITCTDTPFAVGGTLSGYAGSNIVITVTDQTTGQHDTATVNTATGTFSFNNLPTAASGDTLLFAIPQQPFNPASVPGGTGGGLTQTCLTVGQTVTVTNQPVNFQVTCTTKKFDVNVTVTGSQGSQVVIYDRPNNAKLVVTGDGTNKLETLPDGTPYSVTTEPAITTNNLNCYVMNEGPLQNGVPQSGVRSSAVVAGQPVSSVAVQCAATGRYLYVTQPNVGGSGTILGYAINVSGVPGLTPLPGNSSPPMTGSQAGPLSIAPFTPGASTLFAYVADFAATNGIGAYTIDNTTGAVTSNGSLQSVTNPSVWALPVVFDQTGQFAYITSFGIPTGNSAVSGGVSAFPLSSNGTMGAPAFTATGYGAWGELTFTPDKQFAYQANSWGNSISAFKVTAGALQLITTLPLPSPLAIAVDPTQHFLYVLTEASPNPVFGFAIQPDGTLVSVPGIAFGDLGVTQTAYPYPGQFVIDPSGTYLFIANGANNSVSVFRLDPSTGALNSTSTGSPFAFTEGVAPATVTLDPSGKFVFVVYTGSCTIGSFALNLTPNSVALTPAGFYSTGGVIPSTQVATDPSGAYLFVGNTGSANIAEFGIDNSSGALLPIQGSPFAAFTLGTQTYTCGQTNQFPTGPGTPTILQ